MAQPAIQTAFASGEWAPKLRSRVDIQKYKVGAALLRNFFVDWAGGGASTRQGTRFVALANSFGSRLIPFQPSATLSYVLEFGQGYVRFYSNGAQIMSGGVPYQIGSPYLLSDLFPNPITGNPGIKYVQDATSMIICHPSYPPQILTYIAQTNWSITAINFTQTISSPTGLAATSTLAALAGGWSYGYGVTAVDANGQESAMVTTIVSGGPFKSLNDTSNPGTNTITWTLVPNAASYNVYKASPIYGTTFVGTVPAGFIGNTTNNTFWDATPGFAPDFGQGPPILENPFFGAGVQSYTITASGTYTAVPSVTISGGGGVGAYAVPSLGVTVATINSHGPGLEDIITNVNTSPLNSLISCLFGIVIQVTGVTSLGPIGGGDFAWEVTSISISSPGSITSGSTPANPIIPIGCNATGFVTFGTGFNFNMTWGVTQLTPTAQGVDYTSAPSVVFSPGGATATAVLGPASAGNPGVPGFFQERLCFAGKQRDIQGFNFSQPGSFFNFNISFPVEDDDAISGDIIAEDLNAIKHLVQVPTGLLAMTGKAGWLLNAGGTLSTGNPLSPTNIVAQPQGYHGSSDVKPLKINQDILYVTNKGQYVRDLTYNIWTALFSGVDITAISTHLFQGTNVVDWCWCEEPLKTVWAVRSDGVMLSLAWVKDQELAGWAHHDTNGYFKSCCTVIETIPNGEVVDAVYVIVERSVNGVINQYIERMQDRYFTYGHEDSWSVDCGMQNTPDVTVNVAGDILFVNGDSRNVGSTVTLVDAVALPFSSGMVGWVVRAGGGIYVISVFTNTSTVLAQVARTPPATNPYTGNFYLASSTWTITRPISTAAIPQLPNTVIVGVSDGVPFTATTDGSGNATFPSGSKIIAGLAFTPQLQTLPLDLGEPTVQSKRKKLPAATMRVTDTLGLQIGTSFSNLTTVKDFQLNAIPTQSNGPAQVTDLFSGDGRQILDQVWQEPGQLCIQQNLPYPATILGVMPEVVVGDSATAEGGGGRR